MTDNKMIKIWSNVLEDVCGCYADSEGNRPCDYGSNCNQCENDTVSREFRRRLDDYHSSGWASKPPTPKTKYRVIVHDIVTYYDIEAESEEDAIQQALDWWVDRQPRCEVIEETE